MAQTINVGERIRYFRRLRGWSQEKLALEAGMNPAFVGHLERGLKSPTVTTLDKLVSALGITLETLFSEDTAHTEERRQALDRILCAVQPLDADELNRVADLVQAALALRT